MQIVSPLFLSFWMLAHHDRTCHALSNNLIDTANFSVPKSPSSTRFITNKRCPFAQKGWLALELANVAYEMEEISLYGINGKPDWFWKLNPKGTVPVLVCQGGAVILADSDLILDEIGNVVQGGSKLVPKHEKTQKQVQQFRDTLSQFLPIGKMAVLGGDKEKMWSKLKELDALVQGPYICGEEITVADCAAFPFLWRIHDEFGSLGKHGCPNVQKWLGTCYENPAFSQTVQGSWWWWW